MPTVVYNVFHLEDSTDRQKTYNALDAVLSTKFTKLETPTIRISNQNEVDSFLANTPKFKLNLDGYTDPSGATGWLFGEVGILASNYLAWKNFMESDADVLLLAEDDLFVYSNFLDALDVYLGDLPDEWDMFTAHVPLGELGAHTPAHDVGAGSVCKAYQLCSLACYLLTKQGAKKAIDLVEKELSLPADWFFFKQKNIFNVYAPSPLYSGQCNPSNVDSTYSLRDVRAPLQGK